MELEVTKFNTRTLSTPVFVTKRTRFCPKKIGYQQKPETTKSQPS